jgi:hypothetical protein
MNNFISNFRLKKILSSILLISFITTTISFSFAKSSTLPAKKSLCLTINPQKSTLIKSELSDFAKKTKIFSKKFGAENIRQATICFANIKAQKLAAKHLLDLEVESTPIRSKKSMKKLFKKSFKAAKKEELKRHKTPSVSILPNKELAQALETWQDGTLDKNDDEENVDEDDGDEETAVEEEVVEDVDTDEITDSPTVTTNRNIKNKLKVLATILSGPLAAHTVKYLWNLSANTKANYSHFHNAKLALKNGFTSTRFLPKATPSNLMGMLVPIGVANANTIAIKQAFGISDDTMHNIISIHKAFTFIKEINEIFHPCSNYVRSKIFNLDTLLFSSQLIIDTLSNLQKKKIETIEHLDNPKKLLKRLKKLNKILKKVELAKDVIQAINKVSL